MVEEELKLIKCGIFVDGSGSDPISNAVVLIKGSRIIDVGQEDEIKVPSNAWIIDASENTVMPGLIDLHQHFFTPLIPGREDEKRWFNLKWPSTLKILWATTALRTLIEYGFTTIRDAGSGYGISLREGVKQDFISGPRIVATGPQILCMTAGHVDSPLFGISETLGLSTKADGVNEVRKRTREQIRSGADHIKVMASYGAGTQIGTQDWIHYRNYTLDELKAIVDEAHAVRKPVMAHAQGVEGIQNCILAGVDTIEHGSYLKDIDNDLIELMKKKNIFLVPTLILGEKGPESKIQSTFWREKIKTMWKPSIESFKKAYKMGVNIAMGTDWFVYGENAYELEAYVKYGMSELEAIVSATKTAAEAMHLHANLGTLEKGKLADIIIVDGNPLKDIRILQDKEKILTVIKNGRIEKNLET